MKKIVSTAAALGLLAGLATTASAVEFKISGSYTAEGIYLDKGMGRTTLTNNDKDDILTEMGFTPSADLRALIPTTFGGVDLNSDDTASDAWYQHTFIIMPTMKVNDKVSMAADIRLADNNIWGNQDDTASTMSNNNDVWVRTLYMDYESPIGKFRVGRVPTGNYGLAFADNETRHDRIMWWPNFLAKPWSTLFYIQKNTERDAYNTTSATDTDHYEARLNYKDANLDGGIRYGYTNNNSVLDDEKQSVSVFGTYKMDNLFARAEVTHEFGNRRANHDYDTWGAFAEVGGKFDALSASLMYFYTSGDNDLTGAGNDQKAFGSTGTEFTPLYILTGRYTGLLNPDQISGYHTLMTQTGVHAIVLSADYAVSDRLTVRGAIGWAKADDEFPTQDDEYGWEYNVGAAYKLLDNLTYEARFGYLDTGDYFKFGEANLNTENVYLLSHSLTMTF